MRLGFFSLSLTATGGDGLPTRNDHASDSSSAALTPTGSDVGPFSSSNTADGGDAGVSTSSGDVNGAGASSTSTTATSLLLPLAGALQMALQWDKEKDSPT